LSLYFPDSGYFLNISVIVIKYRCAYQFSFFDSESGN